MKKPMLGFLHRSFASVARFRHRDALFYHRHQYCFTHAHQAYCNEPIRRDGMSLTGREDRYKGLYVQLHQVPFDSSVEKMDTLLSLSLEKWTLENKTAIWLEVPIGMSHCIPVAARHGFLFHHAEGDKSVLYKWLKTDVPCALPRFATHQIGVAGCVVREDTQEILVIKDKHRRMWKFPGGLAELGEDLSATAEREVFEETGIKTEFQGILTFRQQHNQPGAFGRSDIYFVCYMKPLTFELVPDETEILQCVWMKIKDLQADSQTSGITHRVLQLLNTGMQHGFDKVRLANAEFISVYKGLKYKLHHVDVGLPDIDPSTYQHYESGTKQD